MSPGTSRDCIIVDRLLSDDAVNFGFIDTHADIQGDWTTHRDNNAGYSDCHVETYHKEFTTTYPSPRWEQYYVKPGMAFFLY